MYSVKWRLKIVDWKDFWGLSYNYFNVRMLINMYVEK